MCSFFKKNILLAEVGKTGYNLSQGTAIAALSEIPTGSDVTNLGPVSVFRYCMFFCCLKSCWFEKVRQMKEQRQLSKCTVLGLENFSPD